MNGPFDLAKCKLVVDTIYELTKDGYEGKLGIDNHTSAVSRLLQKRGILKRTGSSRYPRYKWVATMPPTDVLYKNILSDYTDIIIQPERKKRPGELPPPVPRPSNLPPNAKPITGNVLDRFSSQQLWDELKKRGAQIMDGEIVIVNKLC